MLFRGVCVLVGALTVGSLLLADETRGTVTKIDNGSITIKPGFAFKGKTADNPEEKTFKISGNVKIYRSIGKDKKEVKLTLDDLKTVLKVTNVTVTITHEGDNISEIKVGGFGGFTVKKKKDE